MLQIFCRFQHFYMEAQVLVDVIFDQVLFLIDDVNVVNFAPFRLSSFIMLVASDGRERSEKNGYFMTRQLGVLIVLGTENIVLS